MKRREFIVASTALLVSPRRSWAQGTRHRLGFLAVGDRSGQALNQAELALLDALRDHGWIEGKNLTIEYRFSQPPDRLPASVADLIALSPDVLLVAGPQAALPLKSATATIPIVFVAVGDPVGLGLVQSLSRPGGNITGLTTLIPDDFLAKRLEILRELVPGASKIAILINPDNPIHRLQFADAEYLPRTARKLGVALLTVEATTADELDVAFASAAAQHADAILDLGHTITFVQAPRIIALAAKYHLPANYLFRHQWRIVGIRRRYSRSVPPCRRLRGQDLQRHQTFRPADIEADQIRANHQHEDCQSARALRATLVTRSRRSGDRIDLSCCDA